MQSTAGQMKKLNRDNKELRTKTDAQALDLKTKTTELAKTSEQLKETSLHATKLTTELKTQTKKNLALQKELAELRAKTDAPAKELLAKTNTMRELSDDYKTTKRERDEAVLAPSL